MPDLQKIRTFWKQNKIENVSQAICSVKVCAKCGGRKLTPSLLVVFNNQDIFFCF